MGRQEIKSNWPRYVNLILATKLINLLGHQAQIITLGWVKAFQTYFTPNASGSCVLQLFLSYNSPKTIAQWDLGDIRNIIKSK